MFSMLGCSEYCESSEAECDDEDREGSSSSNSSTEFLPLESTLTSGEYSAGSRYHTCCKVNMILHSNEFSLQKAAWS